MQPMRVFWVNQVLIYTYDCICGDEIINLLGNKQKKDTCKTKQVPLYITDFMNELSVSNVFNHAFGKN